MTPLPIRTIVLTVILVSIGGVRAQDAPPGDAGKLAAEVARLKAEVEDLKRENAALKEKLAAKEKVTTTGNGDAAPPVTALGGQAKLSGYAHKTPDGWTPTPAKDNKNGMLYRAPDKSSVIFVQVKPKGAAPPEMRAEYAKSVVQMLKQDFAKSKTEVIEPPASQPDPRFFLKVHERIRGKADKIADQTHYYLMPGKDMIELTVITTAEATDQIAMTQRLAEELLLSFKAEK